MMKRTASIALVMAGLFSLTACGDKPQELTSGVKQDVPASQGVGASQYVQPGWKAGDKGGWEQQLKTRASYGQNDYNRIGN